MEFLKPMLGDELYDQMAQKLEGSGVKLADLSTGNYVGKEKFDALAGQLREAQTASRAVQEGAARELSQARAELAAEAFAAGIRFTSKNAKQAFLDGLKKQGLALDQEGRLEGAEKYLEKAREDDPAAFAMGPAGGAGFEGKAALQGGEKANPQAAIRAVMFPGRG